MFPPPPEENLTVILRNIKEQPIVLEIKSKRRMKTFK